MLVPPNRSDLLAKLRQFRQSMIEIAKREFRKVLNLFFRQGAVRRNSVPLFDASTATRRGGVLSIVDRIGSPLRRLPTVTKRVSVSYTIPNKLLDGIYQRFVAFSSCIVYSA